MIRASLDTRETPAGTVEPASSVPAVTVILEWEQARRQDPGRSLRVLRRLVEEARARAHSRADPDPDPIELIVGVEHGGTEEVRRLLSTELGSDAALFTVRFLPAGGLEYYALKNRCVEEAAGEIVVFLDSDVVPEPGWLAHLLAPFGDPGVELVAGNTYVELTGTLSRTFAVTWSFPLAATGEAVRPLASLRANNLAIRREVADRFPFPSMPETSRRTCQLLRQSMVRAGVTMVTADGARVAHPPPAPGYEFLARALSQGRDRVLYAAPGRERTWRGTRRRAWGDLKRAQLGLMRHRREVGLSFPALPVAMAISATFVACCAAGELLTLVARGFMVSHFRV